MTTLIIDPSRHRAPSSIRLRPPPSKSHTMRALVLASMGSGISSVRNYLPSPDTEAMIQALTLLGASIERENSLLKIRGTGGRLTPSADIIHAGNSGLVLRLVGALSALSPSYTVFTGDQSIRSNRPITPLIDGLNQLGATAFTTRGESYAPFVVKGLLRPGHASFSGEDSQPVSAILMAASFLEGPSSLTIHNPGEAPWIGLTLYWLKKLGASIEHEQFMSYRIPGSLRYSDFDVSIPSDFSSAAFPLVAALLYQREAVLEGLDRYDPQGDKALIGLLQKSGASLFWQEEGQQLHVQKSPPLKAATIDVDPIIDAIPILAVVGCYAEGTTHLLGAQSARHKECDRLRSITCELRKMGALVEEEPSALTIQPAPLHGALLDSHDDHRIAMALAIAALGASTPSRIERTACIAKSYPTFVTDLQAMGFCIEEFIPNIKNNLYLEGAKVS